MIELKSYDSDRIYWAVEQVEREAGDIDDLHLDDELFYLKSDVDAAIAELKAEINRKEGVGQRWFEQCMEARTENVKLKRALWLARTEMARTSAWVFWSRKDDYNYNKWKKVERKCRAKAEEYK